jgi:hypothetical protein
MSENTDRLLPPAEAAGHLGIGLKKLRELGLPYEGRATRKLYRTSVLDRWLANNGTEKERRAKRASERFTVYRRWIDCDGLSRAASDHYLFETWRSIVRRTGDPHDPNYGGRGITMNPGWRDDPVQFFEDIESELGVLRDGETLDRIDVNDGYFIRNLRKADYFVQNRNRRNVIGARRKQEQREQERELVLMQPWIRQELAQLVAEIAW